MVWFCEKQKQKQQQVGHYTKPAQVHKQEEKKERTKPQEGGSTKTTKQLLGELYNDRAFLEKLYDSKSACLHCDHAQVVAVGVEMKIIYV